MRAALIAICFVAASCGNDDEPTAVTPSPPNEIQITGGALTGLQGADGSSVEMVTLDPREHTDEVGLIYERLQRDATKEINPPKGLAASEYITVRFPDGRGYDMISSSLLELNGKWYEGDFDYAMAGLLRYIHAKTDFEWNEEHLYSRYPTPAELEEIRISSMIKQFPELDPNDIRKSFEQTGGEQDAGDQAPAAVD